MDYIPGYSTLKNIAGRVNPFESNGSFAPFGSFGSFGQLIPGKMYEYFSGKKANEYELFTESPASSMLGSNISTKNPANSKGVVPINESKIPVWSPNIKYSSEKHVKLDGVIYTCVAKLCFEENPVKSIVDNNVQVNSKYWKYEKISSKVKQFNPDTDAKLKYIRDQVVNYDDILYKCVNAKCPPDFASSNWKLLYSSVIENPYEETQETEETEEPEEKPEEKPVSYKDRAKKSIQNIIKDFTIEDIPNESLKDKVFRILGIAYPYAITIAILFVAVIFASYSANELLHKEVPYRILAFIYVFYCVSQLAYSNNDSWPRTVGIGIVIYYIYRCIVGPWIWPGIVERPIKISLLPMQPKVVSAKFNASRLASHGDIDGMLRRALRDPNFTSPIGPPPSAITPTAPPGPPGPAQMGVPFAAAATAATAATAAAPPSANLQSGSLYHAQNSTYKPRTLAHPHGFDNNTAQSPHQPISHEHRGLANIFHH